MKLLNMLNTDQNILWFFHKLFTAEAEKEKEVDKETVTGCMQHETHEMFQHWYDEIERKIKRYS